MVDNGDAFVADENCGDGGGYATVIGACGGGALRYSDSRGGSAAAAAAHDGHDP